MSGWQKPNDTLTRITKLELKDRGRSRFNSPFEPGERPGPIQNVVLNFKVREKRTQLHYIPQITWNPIPPGACAADIGYYIVEIRPTTQAGVEKDVGRRYREQVQVNDVDDLEVDNLKITMAPVEHPKTWYWQARVAAVDKANQKGQWSTWTTPKLPVRGALPRPPAPSFVTLQFDRQDKNRHNPFRASIVFAEVGPWDIPPTGPNEEEEDREDDVARYKVEMRRCDSAGNFVFGPGRTKNVEAKDQDTDSIATATFHIVRPKAFYRARVRSIDRFNRRGLWSNYTPVGTARDTTRPPAPTIPAGFANAGQVGCVIDIDSNNLFVDWEAALDPDDTDADLRAITDDIAYFQVQVSQVSNFANILRSDRYVHATYRRFHVTKADGRFYARVRSVDGSGNNSLWATGTANLNYPPAPTNNPTLRFRRINPNNVNSPLRGHVIFTYNPPDYKDDRIDHYVIMLQESEGPVFQIGQDGDPSWRIFCNDPKGDDPNSDRRDETFNRAVQGNWYRARYQAVDGQSRHSGWSPWSAANMVGG